MYRCVLQIACIAAAMLAGSESIAAPLLHAMFQDHAVLQRDRPIAVWGTAASYDVITLTLADHTVTAQPFELAIDAATH